MKNSSKKGFLKTLWIMLVSLVAISTILMLIAPLF